MPSSLCYIILQELSGPPTNLFCIWDLRTRSRAKPKSAKSRSWVWWWRNRSRPNHPTPPDSKKSAQLSESKHQLIASLCRKFSWWPSLQEVLGARSSCWYVLNLIGDFENWVSQLCRREQHISAAKHLRDISANQIGNQEPDSAESLTSNCNFRCKSNSSNWSRLRTRSRTSPTATTEAFRGAFWTKAVSPK